MITIVKLKKNVAIVTFLALLLGNFAKIKNLAQMICFQLTKAQR